MAYYRPDFDPSTTEERQRLIEAESAIREEQAAAIAAEEEARRKREEIWNRAMAEYEARVGNPRIIPTAAAETPEEARLREEKFATAEKRGWKPIEYTPQVVEAPGQPLVEPGAYVNPMFEAPATGANVGRNLIVKGNYGDYVANQIAGGRMANVNPFTNIDTPERVAAEVFGPMMAQQAPTRTATTTAAAAAARPQFKTIPLGQGSAALVSDRGEVTYLQAPSDPSKQAWKGTSLPGKIVADREYLKGKFGEDSEQLRFFDLVNGARIPKTPMTKFEESAMTVFGTEYAKYAAEGDYENARKLLDNLDKFAKQAQEKKAATAPALGVKTNLFSPPAITNAPARAVRRYDPATRRFLD